MRRIALLVVGIALLLPSSAFAQGSSTCQAYNNQLCSSVNSSNSSGGQQGTLPFTGLDVFLLAGGGIMLLGAGFVVRRVSRRID